MEAGICAVEAQAPTVILDSRMKITDVVRGNSSGKMVNEAHHDPVQLMDKYNGG
jgi:hypothetical protein